MQFKTDSRVQLWDPWVLLHMSCTVHLCVPVAHSSISIKKANQSQQSDSQNKITEVQNISVKLRSYMRYLRENYGRDKPYSEIVSITWSRSLRIQPSLFTPRRLGPFRRSISRLSRETSLTARSEKKRLLRRLQSHWKNHKAFFRVKKGK